MFFSYGRLRSIQAGIVIHVLLWVSLIFSEDLAAYGITLALCEVVSVFMISVLSSYGVEIVGPTARKYIGSLLGVSFALGVVLLSVFAMYFPDRQVLTAVLSVFSQGLKVLSIIDCNIGEGLYSQQSIAEINFTICLKIVHKPYVVQ